MATLMHEQLMINLQHMVLRASKLQIAVNCVKQRLSLHS